MEDPKDKDAGTLDQSNELDSLEDPGTVVAEAKTSPKNSPKKSGNKIRGLITHINIYLLLFILVIVLASGFTVVSILRNKKTSVPTLLNTQELTADDLKNLSTTNSSVGDPKQTLSVESNAIFSGKVLIRDSLDVAGGIKIGGSVSLVGLTVSGTSSFDQIQGNSLSISGDANIQGNLTIQKTLTTSGGASFAGPISAPQITVQSFQLIGDFQITRHIDAGGGTPSKTNGNLGSGGTSSVSGTDTAGTVTINTGGGGASGCLITVNFAQAFNATPHVVLTPVGSVGASSNYYVTRTTNSFTVCIASTVGASQTFSFDYIVID